MACAPPALTTFEILQSLAATKMASCTFPSLSQGVQRTTSLQPAIVAGIPNINTVENKGAEPPGIYRPTFSIALDSRQQVTPFAILTFCSGSS